MKPNTAIALIVAASILYHSVMGYSGYSPSTEGESLMILSLVFMYAWWALEDAKSMKFHRPFEFGAFIFLAWPIALPAYLVATRGWRGLIVFTVFILLYYLPWLSGWLAYYTNTKNQ